MRAFLVAAVVALLAGCAGLRGGDPTTRALVKPPRDSNEAVLIAQDYVARGRWQAALDLLEQALVTTPGDEALLAALAATQAGWVYQEQLLEDRITLGDAENQLAKIALLEQLSRAAPDDVLVASRRLYWKEVLRGKGVALTDCAERYVISEPALARGCYRIATDVVDGELLERRLAAVRDTLKQGEQLAEERRRLQSEKERDLQAKVLLAEARAAIKASHYRKALDTLQRVGKLQPDNPEVAALRQSAWSMISPQVEALVKLGDHLYLDEQLDAAVATWQAALNLKPEDEEIAARIERARNVLERLESLRERQRPPHAGLDDKP